MRIDVHTHIFPPRVVRNRHEHFEGEGAFELLYGSGRARLATAEDLLRAMDEDQVHMAVVSGFPWKSADRASRHNDHILESCSRHPHRLIPLSCVDPLSPHAMKEAERCLGAGARGLGEIAIYEPCPLTEGIHFMEGLVELCRNTASVLLVHANEPVGHLYPGKAPMGLPFFYELARMSAGIPLILAHWGGGLGFYETLKREAVETLAHVHYDTAASPYLYDPRIYSIMNQIVGPEKILLGTDFPLLSFSRYDEEMKRAGLSDVHLKAIQGMNAARIFNIQGGLHASQLC